MVLNITTTQMQVASKESTCYSEVSKILSAAVINQSFRELLLSDPAHAIDEGFRGQMFYLTAEEKMWITSIKTNSITEFAQILSQGVPSYQIGM